MLLNDAEALVNDAEALVNDLEALKPKPLSCVHDCRMARYMHARARRAAGHIELQNAIQNAPDGFYDQDHRPTSGVSLNSNVIQKLEISIGWMRKAEDWSPTTALYCNIAESYLLCGNFVGAQAYARHATLQARRRPANSDSAATASPIPTPNAPSIWHRKAGSSLATRPRPLNMLNVIPPLCCWTSSKPCAQPWAWTGKIPLQPHQYPCRILRNPNSVEVAQNTRQATITLPIIGNIAAKFSRLRHAENVRHNFPGAC